MTLLVSAQYPVPSSSENTLASETEPAHGPGQSTLDQVTEDTQVRHNFR